MSLLCSHLLHVFLPQNKIANSLFVLKVALRPSPCLLQSSLCSTIFQLTSPRNIGLHILHANMRLRNLWMLTPHPNSQISGICFPKLCTWPDSLFNSSQISKLPSKLALDTLSMIFLHRNY